MKIGFSHTAVHPIRGPHSPDFLHSLPKAIQLHTGLEYLCAETDTGYYLKPTFRNMPCRNSFVPEIFVGVSRNNGQTELHIHGQPVKPVRIFMGLWFGFLPLMELMILAIAVFSGFDSLFPVFIPVILCVFGYLLCETATKITFRAVLKAIGKDFP